MDKLKALQEKLSSFEDACKIEGLDPKKVIPDFSCYPEQHRESMESHARIVIIVAAANRVSNEGNPWFPDFDDRSQPKYEVWFKKSSSGFRFHDCDRWFTFSFVGSRLCVKGIKECEHIGKYFPDLYKKFMIINN